MTVPVPLEPCVVCGKPKTFVLGTWYCRHCDPPTEPIRRPEQLDWSEHLPGWCGGGL